MAWSKSGSWVIGDALFWVFYVILTSIVIILLVFMPAAMMKTAIKPVPLDAALFSERILQHATLYSPVTGSERNTVSPVAEKTLQFSLSKKKFGYNITVDRKQIPVGNELFYISAIPLAPNVPGIKNIYYRQISGNQFKKNGKTVYVNIDLIYPFEYETFQ